MTKNIFTMEAFSGGGCRATIGDKHINFYGWTDVWRESESIICLTLTGTQGNLLDKRKYQFNLAPINKKDVTMTFQTDHGPQEITAPAADVTYPGTLGLGPQTKIHETGNPPLTRGEQQKLFQDTLAKLAKEGQEEQK